MMQTILNKHIWHFSKIGGQFRVTLNRIEDVLNLYTLDKKLWTALSCPVQGLEFDPKTLQLIDSNGDNQIRINEVIAAVNHIATLLKDKEVLLNGDSYVLLSNIDNSTAHGASVLASAKQILKNIGKENADRISVEDTQDSIKIFAETKFNGDGIIIADSADDATVKQTIIDILSCVTPVTDRSGKDGINEEQINNFYTACNDYTQWMAKAEANKISILPFAENTAAALLAYENVKDKIDDYFVRCRLAAYDLRAVDALNTLMERFVALSDKSLSDTLAEVESLPLAYIDANRNLPLANGINPAWTDKMKAFTQWVVNPIFAQGSELSYNQWLQIGDAFTAYKIWISEKAGVMVEKLGIERVQQLINQNKSSELMQLVANDKALEHEANAIGEVDKLVRYNRDIYKLLRNFVSFTDFYNPSEKAIFQAGTLFIDERSCDFCIKVNDLAKHTGFAHYSGMFLMYLDCIQKQTNEKMTIVAALTNGDVDNIMAGRNAVFYDRKGNDWDATVIKVIENPISIRQAFWSPYKKFIRMIENQIQKFAAEKDKKMEENASAKIQDGATKAQTQQPPVKTEADAATQPKEAQKPEPFDVGKFAGIFAAIGLAIGAIGSILIAVISGFMQLTWWKMILAMVGISLLISGPSMLLAWLKLRKRNLAPLLDANGWAINARALVNITFGRTLTAVASLPLNARRTLKDPYAKKGNFLSYFIISLLLIVIVLFVLGWFDIIRFPSTTFKF